MYYAYYENDRTVLIDNSIREDLEKISQSYDYGLILAMASQKASKEKGIKLSPAVLESISNDR